MRRIALCMMIAAMTQTSVHAQHSFVKTSTDVVCLVPAAVGLVKAMAGNDAQGVIQLGLSSVTGIALNYGLNACIRKNRPDRAVGSGWSDHHAFPSTHSMAAFDGATFLMRRYGWKWGVPAWVVSTWVAWGRVYTKQHDCWDVLAGAAIGAGSALIHTRPLTKDFELAMAPIALGNNGMGLHLSLRF